MRRVLSVLPLLTSLTVLGDCTGIDVLMKPDFSQLKAREFLKVAHSLKEMPEVRAIWLQRFTDLDKQKVIAVVSYSLGKQNLEECKKAKTEFIGQLQKNFSQTGLEVMQGNAGFGLTWVKPNSRRGQLDFFVENRSINTSVFPLIFSVMTAPSTKVITLGTVKIDPVPGETSARVLSVTCFYPQGQDEECAKWATERVKNHPELSFEFIKPKEEK